MNNPSVSTPLRIAAAQSPSVPGDVARNVLIHLAFVRVAASEGVQVLLFPELSLWLPKACDRVPRSTYSSSPPSGTPWASLLGRTPCCRASCAR